MAGIKVNQAAAECSKNAGKAELASEGRVIAADHRSGLPSICAQAPQTPPPEPLKNHGKQSGTNRNKPENVKIIISALVSNGGQCNQM